MKRQLYRFACWLDLWMHDILDRHLTFTLRGKTAAWVHGFAHDLAFICRPDDGDEKTEAVPN